MSTSAPSAPIPVARVVGDDFELEMADGAVGPPAVPTPRPPWRPGKARSPSPTSRPTWLIGRLPRMPQYSRAVSDDADDHAGDGSLQFGNISGCWLSLRIGRGLEQIGRVLGLCGRGLLRAEGAARLLLLIVFYVAGTALRPTAATGAQAPPSPWPASLVSSRAADVTRREQLQNSTEGELITELIRELISGTQRDDKPRPPSPTSSPAPSLTRVEAHDGQSLESLLDELRKAKSAVCITVSANFGRGGLASRISYWMVAFK